MSKAIASWHFASASWAIAVRSGFDAIERQLACSGESATLGMLPVPCEQRAFA